MLWKFGRGEDLGHFPYQSTHIKFIPLEFIPTSLHWNNMFYGHFSRAKSGQTGNVPPANTFPYYKGLICTPDHFMYRSTPNGVVRIK